MPKSRNRKKHKVKLKARKRKAEEFKIQRTKKYKELIEKMAEQAALAEGAQQEESNGEDSKSVQDTSGE